MKEHWDTGTVHILFIQSNSYIFFGVLRPKRKGVKECRLLWKVVEFYREDIFVLNDTTNVLGHKESHRN